MFAARDGLQAGILQERLGMKCLVVRKVYHFNPV